MDNLLRTRRQLNALVQSRNLHLINAQKLAHAISSTYRPALFSMQNRLSELLLHFYVKQARHPVYRMRTRLKAPQSIIEKLNQAGSPISEEAIVANVPDIAGMSVAFYYQEDLYQVAEQLLKPADLALVQHNDYISRPKTNGYRGLHLTVSVPFQDEQGQQQRPVEILLRTIGMDMWANLEHELCYKPLPPKRCASSAGRQLLYQYAEELSQIDRRLLVQKDLSENEYVELVKAIMQDCHMQLTQMNK